MNPPIQQTEVYNHSPNNLNEPCSGQKEPKRGKEHLADSRQFQTGRKKVHLDQQHNQIVDITPQKKGILINKMDLLATNQATPQKQEHKDAMESPPLREKFAHLIPQFQAVSYSLQHRMLLRIQGKLDQHLQYLKHHRGRKRGDYFKSIRRNLIQGCHIIVDLLQLKQILFLDPELYVCQGQSDKDNNVDVLLDLPPKADLVARKLQFKQKLFNYLKGQGAFEKHKNTSYTIQIPLHKFPFEEKIAEANKLIVQKQQESQKSQAKQQKKLTLKNMFCKDFKFKQALYQKIQQKENKLKQDARLALEPKLKFDRADVLKVLDQLHLAYTAKKLSNMFRATLVERVGRNLNMHDQVASEIIDLICEKVGTYLKKVEHSRGLILQVDRGRYKEAREQLLRCELV